MKHLSLTLLALFFIFNLNAQDVNNLDVTRKNEIGFELMDLIDGAYQLSYERLVYKNFSFVLGAGIKTEDGLVSLSGIDREKIKTGDITYSGFKLIPEIRYYIKKTQSYSLDGFYIGLYFKYSKVTSDLYGTYYPDGQDNTANSETIDFDATIKSTAVGFIVGYKLPLSKRFSLDFMIAGPGAGRYNFSLVNKGDLSDEFYEDLNEALENYSFLDFINADFKFSDTNLKSAFGFPSFRYGISLGYSF